MPSNRLPAFPTPGWPKDTSSSQLYFAIFWWHEAKSALEHARRERNWAPSHPNNRGGKENFRWWIEQARGHHRNYWECLRQARIADDLYYEKPVVDKRWPHKMKSNNDAT